MNFGQAIASGFRNYVTFSGRAARSEYWYWVLFTVIVSIATMMLDRAAFPDSDYSPLNAVFNLATILPSLAVGARRLHDIGRTGWWLLIALTLIGIILLIIWDCRKSDSGPNAYGPQPAASSETGEVDQAAASGVNSSVSTSNLPPTGALPAS